MTYEEKARKYFWSLTIDELDCEAFRYEIDLSKTHFKSQIVELFVELNVPVDETALSH